MATYKVVINNSYGGFGLSKVARKRLTELGCTDDDFDISRHDLRLVQVVEELGKASWGKTAALSVVEIMCPEYIIEEYDGLENIKTRDGRWIDAREHAYLKEGK